MTTLTGVTVTLEDRGQDFLEFDIEDGRITETRPLQGWVWNGQEVLNATISVGNFIRLRSDLGTRTLRYPVIDVQPIKEAALVQVGPTDI